MRSISLCLAIGLLLIAPACRTAASDPTGFVDQSRMTESEKYPFQLAWKKPGFRAADHKKVFIAPVRTDYVLDKPWYRGVDTNYGFSDYQKDLAAIAKYTRDSYVNAFRNDPRKHFQVVNQPEPDALVVELALAELIPAEPVMKAAGWVVPFPASLLVGKAGEPAIGFEGRVRMGGSDEVLGAVAFRDVPPITGIDLQNLTDWWDADKELIRKWAALCVQVANGTFDPENFSAVELSLISWPGGRISP